MGLRTAGIAFTALVLGAASSRACDLCALYNATQAVESKPGWNAALFEQYTRLDTLQMDGHEIPNTTGQHLDSSISTVILGYQFNERFGIQLHAPYIHRSFSRPEGYAMERGTESGLGDCSVAARYMAVRREGDHGAFILNLMAGLKFPTGDSSRLKEELFEEEPPEGAPESGIHGHDLALGSGSLDGLLGASFFYNRSRFLATGSAQYAWRGVGSYGYRYADDLSFALGAGGFLVFKGSGTLALQLKATGETKGKDTFRGEAAQDTALTQVYLGPELSFTRGDRLSGDLAVDLPVISHNSSLQVVPTWRVRAAVSWKF